jgi:uroporphyrinogen-III synthase
VRGRLSGQRIALFESRMEQELAELVRRSGGVPVSVPAVVEQRRDAGAELATLLDALATLEVPAAFVFSTGVGARALLDEARLLGRAPELREAVRRGGAICRGPKAVAALHREGIGAALKAASPYTTAELVDTLETLPLQRKVLVLVHYGERNEPLVEALTARGAVLSELLVYGWAMPEDTAPLAGAVEALIRGELEAAVFTTQIQARHLMAIAERTGRREALVERLALRSAA